MIVPLSKENRVKMHQVAKLVAEAFIPNPKNLPVVLHKNDLRDNSVDNLYWGTYEKRGNNTKEQSIATQKKNLKTAKAVMGTNIITGETIKFKSLKEAQQWLGKGNIGKCCKGVYKSVGGYHWKYID